MAKEVGLEERVGGLDNDSRRGTREGQWAAGALAYPIRRRSASLWCASSMITSSEESTIADGDKYSRSASSTSVARCGACRSTVTSTCVASSSTSSTAWKPPEGRLSVLVPLVFFILTRSLTMRASYTSGIARESGTNCGQRCGSAGRKAAAHKAAR